jgi:hypothetical protein
VSSDQPGRDTALTWPIRQEAGSWRPRWIVLTDPDTTPPEPMDLTAGFTARMVIATRRDGHGVVLAELDHTTGLRLTADGRLYYEPDPEVTSSWTWRHGWHQIELYHPGADKPVRVAQGPISVSPELAP